jgi:hypothetical protein
MEHAVLHGEQRLYCGTQQNYILYILRDFNGYSKWCWLNY